MKYTSEKALIKVLRERIRSSNTQDVSITYQVTGGMPRDRVEQEIEIRGDGTCRLRVLDAFHGIDEKEQTQRFDVEETAEWISDFESLLANTASLDKIEFVPDSLVGVIKIRIGEEQTEVYFRPDEDEDLLPQKMHDLNDTKGLRNHIKRVLSRPIRLTDEDEED